MTLILVLCVMLDGSRVYECKETRTKLESEAECEKQAEFFNRNYRLSDAILVGEIAECI